MCVESEHVLHCVSLWCVCLRRQREELWERKSNVSRTKNIHVCAVKCVSCMRVRIQICRSCEPSAAAPQTLYIPQLYSKCLYVGLSQWWARGLNAVGGRCVCVIIYFDVGNTCNFPLPDVNSVTV